MGLRKNPWDKATHPFVYSGHQYALDVVSKKITACVYVIGACKRYLEDLDNKDADYRFDEEKGERYLRLVQKFKHVIGTWDTEEIKYLPWQNFVFMCVLGFVNKTTNLRRFRIAHIEVARGNGKSAMASQCLLFFLALDDFISGNQISTVATKKDQARIVLDSARAMAKKSPSFLNERGVKVLAHSIIQSESNSVAKALSARDDGLDGLNDVLAILDELHAMRREIFDVIYSGMSKRKDSLTLCITTAGFDMESVGYSQSSYAKKVCLGEVIDDQMFAIVYTLDDEDILNDKNIFDEKIWIKANPCYGHSVDPVTFRAKAIKAKDSAADLPNFKVKHLNIWISEAKAFFDKKKWESLGDPTLKIENFKGQKVYIGTDVASHIDLNAVAYLFKKDGLYYFFDKCYLPEVTLTRLRNTLYDNSVGTGHLIKVPGEAMDQAIIETELMGAQKDFKIVDCLLDPWNTLSLMQSLKKKRVHVTEFRMTTSNLSEPTKTLDKLIRQGKVRHNGSPLISWCLGNVVCKEDAASNIFPRKTHEKLKIDPIIAMVMALASLLQDEHKAEMYSDGKGLRFL